MSDLLLCDGVMSSTAAAFEVEVPSPCERMDAFFAEVGGLTGALAPDDGRLVEIVAQIDRDGRRTVGRDGRPVIAVVGGVEDRCVAA